MRVVAALFVATSLPMINLSCRPRFGVTGIQTAGACGDFLFSGHASIVAASICLFWAQRWAGAPRWPLALLVPLTVLLVVVSFGYAFERWHYTIDVALGFLVTCANTLAPPALFPAAKHLMLCRSLDAASGWSERAVVCVGRLPVWRATLHLFGEETVGVTKHRYLCIPPALQPSLGGRERVGPIRSLTFVLIIGASARHSTDTLGTPWPAVAEPLWGFVSAGAALMACTVRKSKPPNRALALKSPSVVDRAMCSRSWCGGCRRATRCLAAWRAWRSVSWWSASA